MIAHAKIKTDTIDATVLARLYASSFLPKVWVPDAKTLALRRQVTRRNRIVRQRVRLKTIAQSILLALNALVAAAGGNGDPVQGAGLPFFVNNRQDHATADCITP